MYEFILKFFRYNQGSRGTFFYSKEHSEHIQGLRYLKLYGVGRKNYAKLDNGKIIHYTEMSGNFNSEAYCKDNFDDYQYLGRGRYLSTEEVKSYLESL